MHRNTRALSVLLGAILLCPVQVQADIVQRLVITSMDDEKDLEGADVLTVAEATGCGGNQVRMKKGMLKNQEAYASLRPELLKRIRGKTPMVVTLFGCPTEKTGVRSVPLVRWITGCDPSNCADSTARLYLDERWMPQAKRRSPYVLLLPLPAAVQAGLWKVAIYDTIRTGVVRISGLTNAADFVSGNFVGEYRSYDLEGTLETKAQLDAHGRQNGPTETYYANGNRQSLAFWSDGQPEGEYSAFYPNGQVRIRGIYGDDGLLLHYQQFNAQSVLTEEAY